MIEYSTLTVHVAHDRLYGYVYRPGRIFFGRGFNFEILLNPNVTGFGKTCIVHTFKDS